MTQPDKSVFHISARGGQWWELADVTVTAGRATIVVDDDEDHSLELTAIQTAELGKWLIDATSAE